MRVALFAVLVATALAQISCSNCGSTPIPSPPWWTPPPPTPPPPPPYLRKWCDMRGDWQANTDTLIRNCRRNAQNVYFCSHSPAVGTPQIWRDAEVTKAFVNRTNLYDAAYKQPIPDTPNYQWFKMIFDVSGNCTSIGLHDWGTGALLQTWTRVLPIDGITLPGPVPQPCEEEAQFGEADIGAELEWKNAAVAAHNYWRCLFPGAAGLVRVTWDQVIADQLAGIEGKVNVCGGMQHTLPAHLQNPPQGENLATIPNMDPTGAVLYDPLTPMTARWSTAMRMAVDLWMEERVNWVGPTYAPTSCRVPLVDPQGKTCPSVVGHFTQAVWTTPSPMQPTVTTKGIGCVMKFCPQAEGRPLHWAMIQIGCRYTPPGNWNLPPYENADLESTYRDLNLSKLPHGSLLVAAMGAVLATLMAAIVVVVRRRRTAHAALDEALLVDEVL